MLCMETDPRYGGEPWFLIGLVSFLIGHIFFIFAMKNRIQEYVKYGVENNNNWAMPVIAIFAVTMVCILCPNVDDIVLRIGVVFYAGVIGTMAYNSMILATVEQNLKSVLANNLKKLKDDKTSTMYMFTSKMQKCNKGSLFGFRIHAIASISFLVSDSILGYSKFVEQAER